MSPLVNDLRFILLAIACLFSGLTLEVSAGRGFVLLMLPLIIFLVFTHLIRCENYQKNWLAGVSGFFILCALNGSRLGSMVLVFLSFVLYELLYKIYRRKHEITKIDLRWLTRITILMLSVAVVDLMTGRSMNLWSTYSEHKESLLDLPRLRLFFSEPSYLGMFCVMCFFKLHGHVRYQLLMILLVILTHSLFAAALFLFLLLPRRLFLMVGLFLFSLIILSFLARAEPDLFFLSSGLVRLVGLSLLGDMQGITLFMGNGLGSGDLALEKIFNQFGVDIANGFLFSLIYDVGLLGSLFLCMIYVRNFFDFLLLGLLLLNLGVGSFLLPVLMFMGSTSSSFRVATYSR